jgi:hypothetical protein
MRLFVTPTGDVHCLYSEELRLDALGMLKIRRASHVEPTQQGKWTADLSPLGGPMIGPFARRSEALAAETEWIEAHLTAIPN